MMAQRWLNPYARGVAAACARFTQGFFDHGIFDGIDAMSEHKSAKFKAFSGLFTIEWE
jgi:hypothetical protein